MKKIQNILLILSILAVITTVQAAPALSQPTELSRQVVSAGYTSGLVGNVTLNGTLGQPLVGTQVNGDTTLGQGFWQGTETFVEWLVHLPLILK